MSAALVRLAACVLTSVLVLIAFILGQVVFRQILQRHQTADENQRDDYNDADNFEHSFITRNERLAANDRMISVARTAHAVRRLGKP